MEKILFIDDDYITSSLNKLIIKDLLPEAEVLLVSNGLNALDLIDSNLYFHLKQPDLIILDLYMPIMDGFEFLEELNKRHLSIPVVLITGSKSSGDLKKARNFPILDYIEKPFNTNKFKLILQKFWAIRKI